MNDILLYESGGGGEISLKNGDIEMTDGLFNMPYLSHFGGNLEASTKGDEEENIERFDWWGNSFLDQPAQMNSLIEKTLDNTTLNSAGRVIIERNAKEDLQFIADIADISCIVEIPGVDKVKISDKINQIKVDFIFNSTNNELIEEIII
jgi:hypothetical protein